MKKPNQSAATNRHLARLRCASVRQAGQSGGLEEFARDFAADRAFPVAVAELDR